MVQIPKGEQLGRPRWTMQVQTAKDEYGEAAYVALFRYATSRAMYLNLLNNVTVKIL